MTKWAPADNAGVWWDEPSDEIVRRHYKEADGGKLCAKLLGRSVQSVRKRASFLGIKSLRMWTPEEERYLTEQWGKVRPRVLVAELKRPHAAIKQKALKLGLDAERFYTEEQKQKVREMYPTHTAPEIAVAVFGSSRSARAVWRLANILGLQKWKRWPPAVIAKVTELHGEGLGDGEIAREMADWFQPGLKGAYQVKAIRRDRLKLPRNVAAKKRCLQRGHKKQLESMGLSSFGHMRREAYRKYAIDNGWPEDLRPREVQILNLLAHVGVPMTKLEIAQALGMRTDRRQYPNVKFKSIPLLTGNGKGGTYTASLCHRGLLTRMRRAALLFDKPNAHDLFCLGPEALAILERRCQTTRESTEPSSSTTPSASPRPSPTQSAPCASPSPSPSSAG